MATDTKKGIKYDGRSRPSNEAYKNGWNEIFLNKVMKQDLLEASTQKPIDQEQFMLIEDLYKSTEKLEKTQEQNMTNKVNIQFLKDQLDKALRDIEKLKDK